MLDQKADFELARRQFEQTYHGERVDSKSCFNTCASQYYRDPQVGPGNPISAPEMGGWNPSDQRWRCNVPKVVEQKGGGKPKKKSRKSRTRKECRRNRGGISARGYFLDMSSTIGGRPVHQAYSGQSKSKPSKLVNYNGRTFACKQPCWSKTCI